MSLPNWPHYDLDTIEKVKNILLSSKVNYWTGKEGREFEKEFAEYAGTNFAIAVSNGSLSLSCCYLASFLKKDDEVITTPRTFIATASSLSLLGAKPIFADVDYNSGNITAKSIEPLINKKTKAISLVHLGGWPVEIFEIKKLADNYGLLIIEDCAQAHGAGYYKDNKFISVGSIGDIASWSFCQDKIISTGGEGGMVTTNNKKIYELIWSFKDHGKSLHKIKEKSKQGNEYKWLHDQFGSNFRLTEIQSSIGRIQLKKLNLWNSLREKNSKILTYALKDINAVRLSIPPKGIKHAWYKYYCYLNLDALSDGWSRSRILNEINDLGFPASQGSCSEIYLEQCFKNKNLNPQSRLPVAKKLGETSLMFLVHPTITEKKMYQYTEAIVQILRKAMI